MTLSRTMHLPADWDFDEELGTLYSLRTAPRVRPEYGIAGQGGRGAGYSMAAIEPLQPRAIRPRSISTAYLRRRRRGAQATLRSSSASDKEETNGILRDLGLPVPQQALVRNPARRGTCSRRTNWLIPSFSKPLSRQSWPWCRDKSAHADEEVETGFERASEHGKHDYC